MDKMALSESDICDKYIRPAMLAAGWHALDQIYREFPLRAGFAPPRYLPTKPLTATRCTRVRKFEAPNCPAPQ